MLRLSVALAVACARACLSMSLGAGPQLLTPDTSVAGTTKYTFTVTAGTAAPDCARSRPVFLVNGVFQPAIEVAQGDRLEVTVINKIPKTIPGTTNGISIHWHGFAQEGSPWYDGTGYIAQCPIARNRKFVYSVVVNDPPGTYWWHDHSGANRGDGLQGALIVRPKGSPLGQPPANEHILFLQDWWHYTGGAMAMRLNRPFDPSQVTNSAAAAGAGLASPALRS